MLFGDRLPPGAVTVTLSPELSAEDDSLEEASCIEVRDLMLAGCRIVYCLFAASGDLAATSSTGLSMFLGLSSEEAAWSMPGYPTKVASAGNGPGGRHKLSPPLEVVRASWHGPKVPKFLLLG